MPALDDALSALTTPERVERLYLPIARWALDNMAAECQRSPAGEPPRPFFLGINGPQGSGKSTLAAVLAEALSACEIRAVSVSIDDFYLPHAEQVALAAAHPGDPFLEHRGYPGTHDVALGAATLQSLSEGGAWRLPTYDKSLHGGRGDRLPVEQWRVLGGEGLENRWDLVILEGWMLGFTPVGRPPGGMETVNRLLAPYAAWNGFLDGMVVTRAEVLEQVVDWRVEAERARRQRGESALSEEEARDYVQRFLPAYRLWAPGLWARPAGRWALHLTLGADRLPTVLPAEATP